MKSIAIDFILHPNPASEFINIEILSFQIDLEFQVIDMNGKIVKKGQLYSSTEQINIQDLENGIYIIQIITNENRLLKTQKLIKN